MVGRFVLTRIAKHEYEDEPLHLSLALTFTFPQLRSN